ncbi:TAP-like protein-domain-containing protein [Mycena polygramma]|nr:TAP-like protein-domain-containing protein [Mycena polygramma]
MYAMKYSVDSESCTVKEPTFGEPIRRNSTRTSALRGNKMTGFKATLFLLPVLCWLYWGPLFRPQHRDAIDWQPCHEDTSFLCGYLEVPTDYDNPSAGMSKLALTNYPATCPRSERLGIIITNFGGPGVPGREASFQSGARIQNFTGNRHDIISFDQRGLGRSTPSVNCFESMLKYQMFKTNTVFETTFSVPKDPFSASGRAVLVEQQKEALALEEIQGAMCAQTVGAEALGFMSTTTTVYDMEEISRVLEGEDALINFWGGSYGTIVGAYLGNMLPHKAGKILIDGVVPGDMWSNEHYDSQVLLRLLLTDSEKTYQLYLGECFNAGHEHCALANPDDESPRDIENRIDVFIDKLQVQPMRVANYTRPGYLTSGGIRKSLFNTLQMPDMWSTYAKMLASAINDSDGAPLMRMVYLPYSDPAPLPEHDGYVETGQGELLRLAISCGDALPYAEGEKWPTADGIVDDILVTMKTSPRFGATVHLMEQHGGCQYWPGTGVGPARFTGPFNKTLATPTLLVANTHDPITPYASAKIVKDTMGDSARLLLQGSAGHSYLAPTTDCATKVIQNYFADGIIPDEPEIWCEREVDNYFKDLSASSDLVERVLGMNSGY